MLSFIIIIIEKVVEKYKIIWNIIKVGIIQRAKG